MLYALGRWKNQTFSSGEWICRPDFYLESLRSGLSWGTETGCKRQIKYMRNLSNSEIGLDFSFNLVTTNKIKQFLESFNAKRTVEIDY